MFVRRTFLTITGTILVLLAAAALAGYIASADRGQVPPTATPAPVLANGWQMSAPRPGLDDPLAGQPVELGLRQRYATTDDRFDLQVEVSAPDGNVATTPLTLTGDAWSFFVYPDAFSGADSTRAGGYLVRYRLGDQVIASDSFMVH